MVCSQPSRRALLRLLGLSVAVPRLRAETRLIDILQSELQRNFSVLKEKGDPAPYFMAYAVTERERNVVAAGGGALRVNERERVRGLDTTVRVGKPQFDNYHSIRGNIGQFTRFTRISLDDNANQINRALWAETDRVYRLAAQRLLALTTQEQLLAEQKNLPADFSSESAERASSVPGPLSFDMDNWAVQLRRWSTDFQRHPKILTALLSVSAERQVRTFVNSEGAAVVHGGTQCRLDINASTVAPDGVTLSAYRAFDAFEAARLPGDAAVKEAAAAIISQMEALLAAPPAEPFLGPAILSGRAAAVFFHEIFGHRVEGHRQKDLAEGQTFTGMVGERVLPEFLSVTFDPTCRNLNGIDLLGFYEFDDEGVRARPVPVVEHGVLRTFLLSRSPIPGFPHSNGHGRREPGFEIVSRQSNLFVQSAKTNSEASLREQLMQEIRRQNKPYGLYFDQVSSGYTTTRRQGLQAFTVVPLVVYRVYADGRPDELIRDVDIVGTPLTSFQKILATSNQAQVFNGFCGAESGRVPVSAVSPALLVSEIEVQRKSNPQQRGPILSAPSVS